LPECAEQNLERFRGKAAHDTKSSLLLGFGNYFVMVGIKNKTIGLGHLFCLKQCRIGCGCSKYIHRSQPRYDQTDYKPKTCFFHRTTMTTCFSRAPPNQ